MTFRIPTTTTKKQGKTKIKKVYYKTVQGGSSKSIIERVSISSSSESTCESNSEWESEVSYEPRTKRCRKNLFTAKLFSTLDRCELSVRDSVYVVAAVAEALGCDIDEFCINRAREERAAQIKQCFQNAMPKYVTVHFDGKLIPALNIRNKGIERLPVVATSQNVEQLIDVPKIAKSTGVK